MSEFVKVASAADLPDPGKMTLELDDRYVVLIHTQGKYYCIDDMCTHDGGPLGDGPLEGLHLCCPRHGAQFDITTGQPLTMPATEPTAVHEVKLDGDDIFVKLND